MLYPKKSMEKSPSAAMTTPAAVNSTERVTCNVIWVNRTANISLEPGPTGKIIKRT